MKKLKNTTTNKLLVLGGVVALGYFAGRSVATPQDKKTLSLAGAIIGLFISTGVMSWLIEPKKEN